jgi:hypothetical protein
MPVRSTFAAALALALSLPSASARAADQACTVSVAGPVKASFKCKIDFLTRGGGAVRILITPVKLPKSVKAIIPGELELPAPVQAQVYPFDRLMNAKVMITTSAHATFSAEKTKKDHRGEVTVTLTKVENVAPGHDIHPSLSGKLEARLVPSGGATGEARVTVTF